MAIITKRTNKKGTSYLAVVRIKGFKTTCKTFSKKSDALNWAADIEVQMKKGTFKETHDLFLDENNVPIQTVAQLINYFKNKVAPSRYSYSEKYNVMFDWWTDKIGDIELNKLAPHNIAYCKQLLLSEKIVKSGIEQIRKPNTVNKYLLCFSAILTFAVNELNLIENHPMKGKIKILPKPDGRKRFLSFDELQLFFSACKQSEDYVYLFVVLDFATGGRYSEILHLKVSDFDFINNQVFFLKTKNKETRGVPVSPEIMSFVKSYIEKHDLKDFIFLNKKSGKLYYIRGLLMKIIKNIGLNDFHIHDIRHTTASYIAMNGGSLLDIAEILGHKSLIMARRYSHLTQKHTASVLNKVTKKIIPDF